VGRALLVARASVPVWRAPARQQRPSGAQRGAGLRGRSPDGHGGPRYRKSCLPRAAAWILLC